MNLNRKPGWITRSAILGLTLTSFLTTSLTRASSNVPEVDVTSVSQIYVGCVAEASVMNIFLTPLIFCLPTASALTTIARQRISEYEDMVVQSERDTYLYCLDLQKGRRPLWTPSLDAGVLGLKSLHVLLVRTEFPEMSQEDLVRFLWRGHQERNPELYKDVVCERLEGTQAPVESSGAPVRER